MVTNDLMQNVKTPESERSRVAARKMVPWRQVGGREVLRQVSLL
jgi:hypothetical protein